MLALMHQVCPGELQGAGSRAAHRARALILNFEFNTELGDKVREKRTGRPGMRRAKTADRGVRVRTRRQGDRASSAAGMALTCVPELAVLEHREDDQQVAQDVYRGGDDEHRGQRGRHPGRPGDPGGPRAVRLQPA